MRTPSSPKRMYLRLQRGFRKLKKKVGLTVSKDCFDYQSFFLKNCNFSFFTKYFKNISLFLEKTIPFFDKVCYNIRATISHKTFGGKNHGY